MNEQEKLRTKLSGAARMAPSPLPYQRLLEKTLTTSIAFAARETNGEDLWSRVRRALTDILISEWRKGALQGAKAEQAFFVTCDRTTMTQADIDGGRLICTVGIAPVKPAEFVILQISQMTAARRG